MLHDSYSDRRPEAAAILVCNQKPNNATGVSTMSARAVVRSSE